MKKVRVKLMNNRTLKETTQTIKIIKTTYHDLTIMMIGKSVVFAEKLEADQWLSKITSPGKVTTWTILEVENI